MKYVALAFSITIIALLGIYGCGDKSTGPSDNFRDLILNLNNMTSNVGQEITIQAVSADSVVKSEAIIHVLRSANETIKIPNIIDDSTYHIDMYADVDDDGLYSSSADESWRIAVPASGIVNFTRSADFVNIDDSTSAFPGNGFTMNFFNFGGLVGKTMELRVIDAINGHTAGAYRLDKIPGSVFTIYIPGIIMNGTGYQIDFYIDMNVNNSYDPPPEDQAWRLGTSGTSTGININFSHNTNYKDIGF